MCYYQGDFYAGARGDPGIGSFFGSLLGMGASLMPGGCMVKKTVGVLAGAATHGRGIIKRAGGVIMKHPVLSRGPVLPESVCSRVPVLRKCSGLALLAVPVREAITSPAR